MDNNTLVIILIILIAMTVILLIVVVFDYDRAINPIDLLNIKSGGSINPTSGEYGYHSSHSDEAQLEHARSRAYVDNMLIINGTGNLYIAPVQHKYKLGTKHKISDKYLFKQLKNAEYVEHKPDEPDVFDTAYHSPKNKRKMNSINTVRTVKASKLYTPPKN